MQDNNYSKTIEISTTPKNVFKALNEGLNTWWGKISNEKFKNEGQFTITFENEYWWTFEILEYIPNKELVWKCVDGEPDFNKEWIGHILHWTIEGNKTKSTINFQQTGLTPELHCYDTCSKTWDMFISEKLNTFLEGTKQSI